MSRESDYWAERWVQVEDTNHRTAEETMAFVDEAYRRAEREVEGQLSTWYQRFADNNGIVDMAEARRLLNSNELAEFRWTLEDYIKHGQENGISGDWTKELENASARFHITRLEALRLNIQQSCEVLYGNTLDRMDDMMRQTYLGSYYHTAFTIQTGAGIGWNIAALNQKAIQTAVNKPWSLDGRNFSDRLWSNRGALIQELQKNLTQSLMTGNTCEQTVQALMNRFQVSRNQAARLVYTENAYIQAVAQGDSYRANGVKKYQFIATLDDRTSDICREMDGRVFDIKDYNPGQTVPPLHPWCRSCTAPYFESLAGIGERAARNPETGKTYFVPRSMKYEDWKKTFVDGGDKDGLTETPANGILDLNACTTVAQVEQWMRDHNWFRPDSSGTGTFDISLAGCDLESAKALAKSYEEVFDEFPFLAGNIDAPRAVSLGPGTYAQCYTRGGGRVEVSTRVFKSFETLKQMYEHDVQNGFHPVGTDWTAIVTHEIGHALDGFLTNRGLGGFKSYDVKDVSAMMRPKVMRACGLKVSDAGREVSRYATSNNREWFAECFAEAMKSENPRRVAVEFMRQLREIVKGVTGK